MSLNDLNLNGGLDAEEGEVLLATFSPDKAAYWRSHVIMAVIGSVLSVAGLWIMDNPDLWVGPVAAVSALLVRGLYLSSETMGLRWQLTNRRLVIPGGRAYRLDQIKQCKPLLGDVQIITQSGEKHLIKNQPEAASVIAQIDTARGAK